MPHPPLSCPPMTRPLLLPHRRLHACRCHTRRFPDRHRHAGTGQPHPCHSALSHCHRAARDTLPAAATPVSETPTRSPSSPALKPQVNGPRTPPTPLCMASTRAHAGWSTRRCVELPSTNPTKSIQNQYNNRPTTHTTTVQQPYNNRTKTRTKTRTLNPSSGGPPMRNTSTRNAPEKGPKGGAGATPRHLRYGAAGEAGGLPEGPPQPPGPQGRRRCHPSPHCATARRGRPEAYPKGRPNPAGPQGRRRRHLSSPCATARRERPEAYPRGRPYCQKSDPAPPEIGRGSKRALTHRAGKSNRLM